MPDEQEIIAAGAFALEQLSRFTNAEVRMGRCHCTDECANHSVVVYREPLEDDQEARDEPYPVCEGRGPSVWAAAFQAYLSLEQKIAEVEARNEEIAYLNDMWQASPEED